MSVYIKGFPLPNNCGACPLRLAWCRERIYMVTRPERCPLVPVPPHGRLIDADKLCLSSGFSTATEYGMGRSDQIEAIKSNAPTIIPAEPSEEQREYEAAVEAAQYCEIYEPTYDSETGAM